MRAWEDIRIGRGNKMNRKAQEEIVGFVLIVVIVAIIFLVFLGIMIRQPGEVTSKESRDVSQFLGSMMEMW